MSENSPGESEDSEDGHSGNGTSVDVGLLDPASHSDTSSINHLRSASPGDTGSSFLRGLDPGGDETSLQDEIPPPSVLTFDPASSELPSPAPSVADDSESVAAFLKDVIGDDDDRKPSVLQSDLSGPHSVEQGRSEVVYGEETPDARRLLWLQPRPQKELNVARRPAPNPPPPPPKRPRGKPRGGYICGVCKRPIKEAHIEGICPICEFCGRAKKEHPGGCPKIKFHKETQTGDSHVKISEDLRVIAVSEGVWPWPTGLSDAHSLGSMVGAATPTAATGQTMSSPPMGGHIIRGDAIQERNSGEAMSHRGSILTAEDQMRSDDERPTAIRNQIDQEQQLERSGTMHSDALSKESDDDIEVYEV